MRIMGAPASTRWCCSSRKKQGFRTVTKSVTDPDCGLFVKGEHKRQFAYEAHTACDKNGFVLETVVTPGNVHDSVAFDEVYDKVTENFPQVGAVVADAAYKTPHICKKVFDDGRVLSTAYKRPQTMKNGHESLCCFFAHICSRSSLLLSTDQVPRQTEKAMQEAWPSMFYLLRTDSAVSIRACLICV